MAIRHPRLRVVSTGHSSEYPERRFDLGKVVDQVFQRVGVVAVSLSTATASALAVLYVPRVVSDRIDRAMKAVVREACAVYPHGSDDAVEAYTGGMQFLPAFEIGNGRPRTEATQRAYLAAMRNENVRALLGVTTAQCDVVRGADRNLHPNTNASRP